MEEEAVEKELKMFVFQPGGHGSYSFFVMAKSEEDAREAIEKYRISLGWSKNRYEMGGYYDDDDYYKLTVLKEGEVMVNDNE